MFFARTIAKDLGCQRAAPILSMLLFALQEMGLLVHEKALRCGHQMEMVLMEPTGDATGSSAGEHGRRLDSRVERGRRDVANVVQRCKPLAEPRTFGIRIDGEVAPFLHGCLTRQAAR